MTPIFYFVQLYDWQCLLLTTLEGDQIWRGKESWIYRFGDRRFPSYGFDIYLVTGDTGKDPSLGRAWSTYSLANHRSNPAHCIFLSGFIETQPCP